MKTLSIDGTDVEVKDYQWELDDQDLNSGRNLAGYMERNLLAHSVNKLTLIFPPQNAEDRAKTLQMLHKEHLSVNFLSPYSNSYETHNMMHGNLPSSLYWNVQDDLGTEILYQEFQVELVEY